MTPEPDIKIELKDPKTGKIEEVILDQQEAEKIMTSMQNQPSEED